MKTVTLTLTKRQIQVLLKALNGPSAVNHEVARIYDLLADALHSLAKPE